MEYRLTDEAVDEEIEASEYEFDENGNYVLLTNKQDLLGINNKGGVYR